MAAKRTSGPKGLSATKSKRPASRTKASELTSAPQSTLPKPEEIEEPVAKKIQALVEQAGHDPLFNHAAFLSEVSERLRVACSPGGECDAINPRSARPGYEIAFGFLASRGFTHAAAQLLVGWWNQGGERQLYEQEHIYRAFSSLWLTQLFLAQNDLGAALRWNLLTQADEVLGRHATGGGTGRQWLQTIFGVSDAELGELKNIADGNLKTIESEKAATSKVFQFAEDVVVKLALKDIAFARFYSTPSQIQEFPISPSYFRVLLDRVDALGSNTKDKGDTLELLAAYLFLLIPGWFPSRNVLDENQGFETDLIISNLNPASNLSAELLGRHFLVECKNWARPVPVKDVGYFLHRMRLAHCSFGVMFAFNDVTGQTKGETAARSLIRRTFHEDGITCIVLDRKDLESLATGEISFWSMLLREMQQFRFGKAK